jgi:hypothetical protein
MRKTRAHRPAEGDDDEILRFRWETEPTPREAAQPKRGRGQTKAAADGVRSGWKWDGFTQIPYPLVVKLLRALPDVALRVYVALRFFEGYQSGEMHPGQELLAVLTGNSERAVRKGIAILREAGLIESRRRWNNSNSYEAVEITPQNWPGIRAKLEAMSEAAYPQATKDRRKREPALLKLIEARRSRHSRSGPIVPD